MKTLSLIATMLLGASTLSAACNDLFISEYIEGSSYNKAIELFNATGSDIDLANYTLELYSNGKSGSPTASMQLSGSVSSNETFVIAHPNADAAITDKASAFSSSVISFNGDDAVVLTKNSTVVDAFGQIGVDPGSEWPGGGKDVTLIRNDGICGDTNANDAFDATIQWSSFPKDTFEYLGSHNGTGGNEEPPAATPAKIHDIQGAGDQTQMMGEEVSIEGIVTGNFTGGGFNGFFVQEEDSDADSDPLTSEGVFVYCSGSCPDLHEGDLVQVSGTVTEYSGLTEIKSPVTTVISTDQSLPTAVRLSLPVSGMNAFEAVESMLVTLDAQDNPLVVNEVYNLGRYGTFLIGSERLTQFTQIHIPDAAGYSDHQAAKMLKSIEVDDGQSYQNPWTIIYPSGELSYENTLRAGYTIKTITGVMDQRFGAYRIQPVSGTDLVFNADSNPRAAAPTKPDSAWRHKKSLRVASFNVLNYFNTFEGCTGGYNGDPVDCRGASDAVEFNRQRDKIINAMLEIDADIYGLMEIENDGYDEQSAIVDLVNGLNDKMGKNLYKYVNVDKKLKTVNALGTDAIKVALIYNKKRVRPAGRPHAIVLDEYGKNRPSLLQKFKKRGFGKGLLVSVNHFKSKGSSCDTITYSGIADINNNDGAGNCNLTRTHASDVLTSYIHDSKKLRKNRFLLMIGDFNSYAAEDPITHLESKGFVNLVSKFNGLEEYSYVYKGETGTLDYAISSKKLAKKVRSVNVWHSNTDEPKVLDYTFDYKSSEQHETLYGDGPYRASDHDPVIVDLNL